MLALVISVTVSYRLLKGRLSSHPYDSVRRECRGDIAPSHLRTELAPLVYSSIVYSRHPVVGFSWSSVGENIDFSLNLDPSADRKDRFAHR